MPFMKNVPNPHGKIKFSALSAEDKLLYQREANKRSYLKRVGTLQRNYYRTTEEKAQRARDKSNLRCTRAKHRRFDDEFTSFIVSEAHKLRRLRNECTRVEWHVDHIVPLYGKEVSGLHIWSNLQVIPKLVNLIKGNKFAFHEKWKEGL